MSVKSIRLEEVAEFINGRAFKPADWGSEGLPIIRIQNLTGTNEAFNFYNGPVDERVRVRKGDILISWSASLGVFRWDRDDAVLNQHIFKVRLKDGVDPDYFYHAATNAVAEMASRVHGSTMQHITKDRFESIQIPLPAPPEQTRIAGLLEQADRLRRTRRYALELSDTFLPAAFLQLFGLPDRALMEYGGLSLGDLAKCDWGNTAITKESYQSTGVCAFSASGQDGFVKHAEHEGFGVVISAIGARCGKCFRADGLWTAIKNTITITQVDRSKLHPEFLFHLCNDERFWNKDGAGQPFISLGTVRSTRIPLPPLAQQHHFAALVAQHERLRATQREALRQAEHLFQSLLHQAFHEES